MIRSLTFLSLLACFSATVAMDDQNPVEISLSHQCFMYLGICPDREKAEGAYGCKFPMNTIFVSVTFKPYMSLALMPYDYIHKKNEGDAFPLTINGKQYIIHCKHLDNDHFWQAMKFEELVKYSLNKFSKSADWFPTDVGQDVLVREKVVFKDKSGVPQHGENKSPYVKNE
jgi:hypothetical protein